MSSMSKLFTYSSKIEIPFLKAPPDVVEKFIENLQKWLSDKSGEDADRNGNHIYFAINPGLSSIFIFQGIDSGDVSVVVQASRLIVKYRLSFLFPFLAILILDLFFIGIFCLGLKADFPVGFFVVATTTVLLISVINTLSQIVTFPDSIIEIWSEVRR